MPKRRGKMGKMEGSGGGGLGGCTNVDPVYIMLEEAAVLRDPGQSPSPVTHQLCILGQVTSLFWA